MKKHLLPGKFLAGIPGTYHVFRLGNAIINNDKILVAAPTGTPLPIQAVCYAFTNFSVTNLQNAANLPYGTSLYI